jgi:hypothetical protein
MRELRIHGVGGPSHSRMLGVRSDADVVTEKRLIEGIAGEATRTQKANYVTIVRRKLIADDGVRGFSWGELTSGSLRKALWVLLLPLSLVNVAGWGAAGGGKCNRVQRFLVHVLALLTTLTYVSWIAYLWLDLLALQWRRRVLLLSAIRSSDILKSVVRCFWPAVAAALFLVGIFLWFRQAYRSETNVRAAPEVNWNERIADGNFFGTSSRRRLMLWVHMALGGLAALVAVALFWNGRGHDDAAMNNVVLTLGIVQGSLCLLLLILALKAWLFDCSMPITVPAATIGAATSHMAFSGVGLLLVSRLKDWPKLAIDPSNRARQTFTVGKAISAPSYYAMAVLLAFALTAVVGLLWGIRERGNLVKMARQGLFLALVTAIALLVAGGAFLVQNLFTSRPKFSSNTPFGQIFDRVDTVPTSFLYKIGFLVMTGLPVLVFRQILGSRKPTTRARSFAVVWDLLMFWPRRFHPLAVPSYGQIAVPLLVDEIKKSTENGNFLLLSAHSQGSVLAVAALHQMSEERDQVHLVTYGSPIGGLYKDAFPGQYPTLIGGLSKDAFPGQYPTLIDGLVPATNEPLGSWTNFRREATDPIGAQIIFPAGDNRYVDRPLQDPVPLEPWLTINDDPNVALEWTRTPCDGIAGHSNYLADPTVKSYVITMRNSQD